MTQDIPHDSNISFDNSHDPEHNPDALPAFFASSLDRVLSDYTDFSCRHSGDNAKEFTTHHTACKAALAHLAALMRAQSLWRKQQHHTHTATGHNKDELETLLQQARHVLARQTQEPQQTDR